MSTSAGSASRARSCHPLRTWTVDTEMNINPLAMSAAATAHICRLRSQPPGSPSKFPHAVSHPLSTGTSTRPRPRQTQTQTPCTPHSGYLGHTPQTPVSTPQTPASAITSASTTASASAHRAHDGVGVCVSNHRRRKIQVPTPYTSASRRRVPRQPSAVPVTPTRGPRLHGSFVLMPMTRPGSTYRYSTARTRPPASASLPGPLSLGALPRATQTTQTTLTTRSLSLSGAQSPRTVRPQTTDHERMMVRTVCGQMDSRTVPVPPLHP